MLNPFPDLLTFSFFAPTILRLATAGAFAYGAYFLWVHRMRIAERRFPLVGHAPWLGASLAVAHALLAVMLGAGYYTQIAALLGGLGTVKALFLIRRYPELFPLSRGTYVLLLIMLLSLLLTGAGALAFDLPL
jgi:hypothetical protein